MINLTELASHQQPWRYKMDILKPGQIGNTSKSAFLYISLKQFFYLRKQVVTVI